MPKGITSRCTWREPDLLALADAMREAAGFRRRTIDISYIPGERYGYAAVARLMHSHLSEVLR